MVNYLIKPKDNLILMKKLLTVCPICKKSIYGKDIDLSNLLSKKIDHWPLNFVHCHSHNGFPLHALTIYIDANLSVRGHEVSDFIKVEKKIVKQK